MSLLTKLNTYRRLGLANILRVMLYQLRVKSGLLKKSLPIGAAVEGPFFQALDAQTLAQQSRLMDFLKPQDTPVIFGWYRLAVTSPPNWFQSILNDKTFTGQQQHWSQIADFDSAAGDIKGIWELSRFSWVLWFVQQYIISKDPLWLDKVNIWIADWSANNPVNQGPNWKCAQEASLRIIHLCASALLLQQKIPSDKLAEMIEQHLKRIYPTLGYAKAQDNNHGTSEAVAMFVGSSWLLIADPANGQAKKWLQVSRQYLQERVERLVAPDGTFSQYSVNYHRLMLDTLSFAELWRRFLNLPEFSPSARQRIGNAVIWLANLVDSISGDAANLGANDGAHVLNFCMTSYREFRPSVELAAKLFANCRFYPTEYSENLCKLFALPTVKKAVPKYYSGGYARLENDNAWCLLAAPKFDFRPSQEDMLHLDFWLDGRNILRDAGSYSYNTTDNWLSYFPSCQAHNVVQFDALPNMPKISRFLYAHWPTSLQLNYTENHVQASYINFRGCSHTRNVSLTSNRLVVVDNISGVQQLATLRWRLPDKKWTIDGQSLTCGYLCIQVISNKSISRLALVEGYESRYYGQKSSIPVLEVDVSENAQITTTITW